MTVGIYKLIFKGTEKVYIGRSTDIERRFTEHVYCMSRDGSSVKLNNAYKEYGVPSLEILYVCTIEDIIEEKEREFILKYNAVDDGFNTCISPYGGCSLSGEYSGASIYSNKDIIKVFELLVDNPMLTLQKISNLTGVSKGTVGQISRGKQHKAWLNKLFPEKYAILLSRVGNKKQLIQAGGNNGKVYPSVMDPKGMMYTGIISCIGFAREHGLDPGNFNKVLHGKLKTHKGWKLA